MNRPFRPISSPPPYNRTRGGGTSSRFLADRQTHTHTHYPLSPTFTPDSVRNQALPSLALHMRYVTHTHGVHSAKFFDYSTLCHIAYIPHSSFFLF